MTKTVDVGGRVNRRSRTDGRGGTGRESLTATNRRSRAYEELRTLIVRGRLAPGARIIENDVAERLGLSRTPIRSAFQRLQQEGYIIASSQGKQTRLMVAPLTREDARELFNIVGEVEALAARWAAELPPEPRARLVRELEDLNGGLLETAHRDTPDPQKIFDLHTEFHGYYVAATGAPRLIALHNAVKPQAERYRWLYSTALLDRVDDSVHEHEPIIRSIADGDADTAQRAVQVNWRNAAERLGRIIDTLGERGSW